MQKFTLISYLLIILFQSCKIKEGKIKTIKSSNLDTSLVDVVSNNKTFIDTLQYLGEGENEDNLYSVFLLKKLDTINIVMNGDSTWKEKDKGKMVSAEWENKTMTSGGDTAIRYDQAFMKRYKIINIKPFKESR